VGAVVLDAEGRLLVVRRRFAPSAGRWSLPGGRVERGESLTAAVQREVLEETGLRVQVGEPVGTVEIPFGPGLVYDVTDFRAALIDVRAAPVAGSDASAVAWVSRQELAALDCSPGLAATLDQWQIWPSVS
jgi:8-oxo-dGTP diphosphatase